MHGTAGEALNTLNYKANLTALKWQAKGKKQTFLEVNVFLVPVKKKNPEPNYAQSE